MSDNTTLWDRLGKTNPAHTKGFKRAGGFSGTAIKPMWAFRRMTEEFGPCGTGWGVNEPTFQVVPGPEGEVLVFCTVSIWYQADDAKTPVFGVGGDKVVGKNKYGLATDDEAFKKAFTDAITNALKLIGMGADVHMGMFDDSKYVNALKDEFREETADNGETSQNGEQQSDGRSPEAQRLAADALIGALEYARDLDALNQWKTEEQKHIDALDDFQFERFKKAYSARRRVLAAAEPVNTLEAG